jgi:hypothetical protein
LLSAVIFFIAAVLALHYENRFSALPHICLVQALCGIPCPGCGVTRSVLALIGGDLGRAWALNPGGPVLCAATALQIPLRGLALTGRFANEAVTSISRAFTFIVIAVLLLNWLIRVL